MRNLGGAGGGGPRGIIANHTSILRAFSQREMWPLDERAPHPWSPTRHRPLSDALEAVAARETTSEVVRGGRSAYISLSGAYRRFLLEAAAWPWVHVVGPLATIDDALRRAGWPSPTAGGGYGDDDARGARPPRPAAGLVLEVRDDVAHKELARL